MTIAPGAPRLAFTDLADAVAALRGRGLRLTTPRRLVLEALFAADGPVSAEHIASELRLDLTSVYRNLEALERHGLASHVHLGHGPGLYALVGRGEHEFLSCERCGAVRTLAPEQLDPVRDQIRELFGYQARFTHFAVVGICPACASQEPQDAHPHKHEHSHGDYVHSHSHAHEHGAEGRHRHDHPQG
jgi:Fur family ferric uptake transcriptional regulator